MIRTETEGDLVTLVLDRPGKANALTGDMLRSLRDAVDAAHGAKALILTGTGKVFSAGADLDAARMGLATDPEWERLSGAIAGFSGLTIAALNGTVAGGALGMVLACDLRIAVASAKVFYPVMKLGFLPQPSDPARLSALVGPARAKLILMAGAKIGAEEASTIGLIDRIVETGSLMDEARELAKDVLATDRGHVAKIKDMIGG